METIKTIANYCISGGLPDTDKEILEFAASKIESYLGINC